MKNLAFKVYVGIAYTQFATIFFEIISKIRSKVIYNAYLPIRQLNNVGAF